MAPAPLKNMLVLHILSSTPFHRANILHRLSTYRILHNSSTTWCPDREEHGFMYVPMFKCSTNPKIATAHRWNAADPVGRMAKPTGATILYCQICTHILIRMSRTECFYHKEGVWYYAGLYKGFKMDVLTPKEWSQLPSEVRIL